MRRPTRVAIWQTIVGSGLVIVLIGCSNVESADEPPSTASASESTGAAVLDASAGSGSTTSPAPSATREAAPTTLGAGTFTVGNDVKSGLYDVTPGAGQSGVLSIETFDELGMRSALEVLGGDQGVPVVRVQISDGDKITIRGLSQVTFTQATTRLGVTEGQAILYAGIWIVGEDIAPGSYVAAPGPGQRGFLFVSDRRVGVNREVSELLDESDGNANARVDLDEGDIVSIWGLSQVTFDPI